MAQEHPALPLGVKLLPGLKMHRLQAGEREANGWYMAQSTEGHFRSLENLDLRPRDKAKAKEPPERELSG